MVQKGMPSTFMILQSSLNVAPKIAFGYGNNIHVLHFSIVKVVMLGIMTHQVLDIPGLITIKDIITYTKK